MPDPRKIRIGFIGLSSKPDSWATLAHLPYLRRSPHYEIVALCNSTPEKAAQSIAAHNLPPTTKAYASPAELAADPTIDLIVICTRVDTHYAVALPALLTSTNNSNKAIFIEWPLAATTAQARELLSLAQTHHVRTLIGLQARVSPTFLKIQETIASGRLGAIHSVNIHATSGVWQHDLASARYAHFLKRDVGGNLLTIYGIHILDAVFASVGELIPASYSVCMGNLRPRMRVPGNPEESHHPHPPKEESVNAAQTTPSSPPIAAAAAAAAEEEKLVVINKDTPDQILLTGRLARPHPAPPALLSFHLRAGSRAKDTPGATWRIYGEDGELVVEFASAGPQIGQATRIQIHHFSSSSSSSSSGKGNGKENRSNDKAAHGVEDVRVEDDDEGEDGFPFRDLPVPGQNIGRLYEAFARERQAAGATAAAAAVVLPGWEVALKRHELIDEFWDAGGM
jgi:predicted dehydrogenase